MLRLIIRISLIVLIAVIPYLLLLTIEFEAEQAAYTGAFIDKITALQTHEAGSVLIVGGSYSAFSLDGDRLADNLNTPVVHVGLHAGIGLRFMLDNITADIKAGDIVLLPLEYGYYVQPPAGANSDMMRRLIALDPENTLPYLRTPAQWQPVLTYHAEYTLDILWNSFIGRNTVPCPGQTYCRDSFAADGSIKDEFQRADDESRMQLAQAIDRDPIAQDTVLNHAAVTLLNRFAAEVRANDADIYIILPGLPQSLVAQSDTNLQNFHRLIEDAIEIDVLNRPYPLPEFLYYDTIYHLNNTGKAINTRYIAALLNQSLGQ